MLGLYSGFILLIAYGPQVLGTKISRIIRSLGYPVGVGLIVSAFILTGIYVRRANGEFDDLNNAILKEASGNHAASTGSFEHRSVRSGRLGR